MPLIIGHTSITSANIPWSQSVSTCLRAHRQSSPYYQDMYRRYCCLTSFFPIVDTCLSCEDIVRRSCTMVPRWRIFGDFLGPALASHVQHISNMHSKFAPRPHHVSKWSMVDIQSPTAEIRRGKKKEERTKIEITGQKYNVRTYYIRRP